MTSHNKTVYMSVPDTDFDGMDESQQIEALKQIAHDLEGDIDRIEATIHRREIIKMEQD